MRASKVGIALCASLVLAAPSTPVDNALTLEARGWGSPSVNIANGTVVGTSLLGVDRFIGIPFAKPPVNDLRLRAPQSIDSKFGTFRATGIAPACPQFYFSTDEFPQSVLSTLLNVPLLQKVQNEREDCLTLDIQRPAGVSPDAKLPVLFWIFGGGFQLGSTQLYDGYNIVRKSIDARKDIIYVGINYRVGGFGFLPGKEMKDDGATNLGLKDQRLALQWVAENIGAFGGDPDKVTIWGESAGAISVFDHTIINGGDHTYRGKPLFRAAIMDSGAAVPTQDVDSAKAQKIYDAVVEESGCSSASNTLDCLRKVDYITLLKATNTVPGALGYHAVDLSYLPRPDSSDNFFPTSPENVISSAAKVPVIIGDQEDEGTLFALFQHNITTTADLVDYLAAYFTLSPRDLAQGLVDLYPDSASAGSPFKTGPLYNFYPQFKRLAALLGDAVFTLARRNYLRTLTRTTGVKAYSYLASYFYGTPVLGTFHASDLLPCFFNLNVPSTPANSILLYYIGFVHDLDPNSVDSLWTALEWPEWDEDGLQLMNFRKLVNGYVTDDFRSDAADYLSKNAEGLRV